MAYSAPEDYLAYYIIDDMLALVTNKNTASDNEFEAIDESTKDGLLIEYSAIPDEIQEETDVPDVDVSLHPALMNYVKWKLYEDRPETLEIALYYKRLFVEQCKKWATRTKQGGPKIITPFKLL